MDTTATEKKDDFENGLEEEAGKLHHVTLSSDQLKAAMRYVSKDETIIRGICVYCDDEERGGAFATDGYQAISIPADPAEPPAVGPSKGKLQNPHVVISPDAVKPLAQGSSLDMVTFDFQGRPRETVQARSCKKGIAVAADNLATEYASYPAFGQLLKANAGGERCGKDLVAISPKFLGTLATAANDLARHSRDKDPHLLWEHFEGKPLQSYITVMGHDGDWNPVGLADVLIMEIRPDFA